jgi:hypothetical protein
MYKRQADAERSDPALAQPLEVYHVPEERSPPSPGARLAAPASPPPQPRPEVGALERCAGWRGSQVVLSGGEAGIGKSRLAKALRDQVAEPQAWRLSCQVRPITSTPPCIR